MLSEEKVREMYAHADHRCKELEEAQNELFSQITDIISAEWAVDQHRKLTRGYDIWNNVRTTLKTILDGNV